MAGSGALYLGLAMMPGPVPAAWRERLGRKTGLLVAQVVTGGPANRQACAPGTCCSPWRADR